MSSLRKAMPLDVFKKDTFKGILYIVTDMLMVAGSFRLLQCFNRDCLGTAEEKWIHEYGGREQCIHNRRVEFNRYQSKSNPNFEMHRNQRDILTFVYTSDF